MAKTTVVAIISIMPRRGLSCIKLCDLFYQSELGVTGNFMGLNAGEAEKVSAIYFSLLVSAGLTRSLYL